MDDDGTSDAVIDLLVELGVEPDSPTPEYDEARATIQTLVEIGYRLGQRHAEQDQHSFAREITKAKAQLDEVGRTTPLEPGETACNWDLPSPSAASDIMNQASLQLITGDTSLYNSIIGMLSGRCIVFFCEEHDTVAVRQTELYRRERGDFN
jgi:hypothetical protein